MISGAAMLATIGILLAPIFYFVGRKHRTASSKIRTLKQLIRSSGADRSNNFVQVLINGLQDPVLVIDKDYRVMAMNEAARADCGDLAQQHKQLDCRLTMERLGTSCASPGRPCALVNGKACKHIQERTTATGETRPVEIRMTPLIDESGEFVGAVEVVHDLSESEQIALKLRQAKEDAETVSRAKSECVAMMSHEVRTPMNAVLGMADLLQLTDLTRKQQDYVRTIQSSGSTLLSLVDNVLDFSELQAGQLVMRDQPFDVRQFIEQIMEIMGFQAYSKGLELGCRIEKDVPLSLNGDVDRLRQVMVNLVSNAVRYTRSGEVTISVRTDVDANGEPSWRGTVTDTGVGIPAEVQASLFDPFVRNEQQEYIGRHGSGLGLTVCKWLIEGMGGNIRIDSESARGTRVSFELPLDIDESSVAVETPADILHGMRALVIHGNVNMSSIIGEYLSDYGMSSDSNSNGDAGLQCLLNAVEDSKPYDAVIIDASLHGTDGLSVARRIRTENSISDLPIIFLTPIAYPLKVGEISSIGHIRCINKPMMPTELWHVLNTLLVDDSSQTQVDSVDTGSDAGELRILIAEDNDLSRQLLQNMLASLDHRADAVADGPSVLQALAKEAYDVVLMDCQMPGMDGDEVTRRVRSEPENYRTQPVIVAVTADVSAQHRTVCRDAGMDDFLAKPIRRRQLIEGLRHWRVDLEYLGELVPNAAETMEKQVVSQLQSRGDDNQFLCDYIDLFLADTHSRLDLIDTALVEQDWESIRRQSHALKGACLEMGASAMGQQCMRVHNAAEIGGTGTAPDALRDLRKEFNHILPVYEAAKRHFI